MKQIVTILFFFLAFSAQSSEQILSNEAEIYLLTVSPGEALYSCFGHSALWVIDKKKNIDVVYNYGTFDFDEENFYLKFILGNLKYKLAKDNLVDLQWFYGQEGRAIHAQKINVDAVFKQRIFNRLAYEYQPENRYYLYDFKSNNCATRIADIFYDLHTLSLDSSHFTKDSTFRDLLHVYTRSKPWLSLGIDLILGKPVDEKVNLRSATFLPDYLSRSLFFLNYNGKSFVMPRSVLLPQKIKPKEVLFWMQPWFWICLLFSIGYFLRKKNFGKILYYITYSFLLIFSMLLVFLILFTLHPTTKWNFNLLWANPILFLLPIPWKKQRVKLILIALYLVQVLFYLTGLHGQAVIFEMLPLVLFTSYFLLERNKKLI